MVATELIGNPNYIVIGKGPPTPDTNDKATVPGAVQTQ